MPARIPPAPSLRAPDCGSTGGQCANGQPAADTAFSDDAPTQNAPPQNAPTGGTPIQGTPTRGVGIHRTLTRRDLAAQALAAGVLTLPAAGARAAAGVTIAGPGGWFQDLFDGVVLAAFRKAHPGIGVFFYAAGSGFQTLSLMQEQRMLPYIDVALLEVGVAAQAAKEGLLDAITPDAMPVLKDLIPQAVPPQGSPPQATSTPQGAATSQAPPPQGAGPVLMVDTLALGYDPRRFTQPPRLWRNLWDPAIGNRLTLPTAPDPIALAMTSIAATLFGGRNPAESLEAALTALSALRPRVAVWDPVPNTYTAIAAGDAAIGPGWNARAQYQVRQTPGRYATVIPDDGSPALPVTINLIKGSTAPDAARTLIAWLLGPEAQALLTRTLFYAPVNPRADVPPAVLAKAGADPQTVSRRINIDWVTATAVRDKVTAAWRRHGLMRY